MASRGPDEELLSAISLSKEAAVLEWLERESIACKSGNTSNKKALNAALHLAVQLSNKVLLELLLEAGADCNDRAERGWTPLHRCCMLQDLASVEICTIILKFGGNSNAKNKLGQTPLTLSRYKKNRKLTATIENHQRREESKLRHASSGGNVELVVKMLHDGVNLNASDKKGWTALHEASSTGKISVVHALLQHGGNRHATDADGNTPLHIAAKAGHCDVMGALLLPLTPSPPASQS